MNVVPNIKVERENRTPQALVINGGVLAQRLSELLTKQKLAVQLISGGEIQNEKDAPNYVFYFAQPGDIASQTRDNLKGAISLASRANAKLILVWDNLATIKQNDLEEEVSTVGWPHKTIEIRGSIVGEKAAIDAMTKLTRLAFSGRAGERGVIVGNNGGREINSINDFKPDSGGQKIINELNRQPTPDPARIKEIYGNNFRSRGWSGRMKKVIVLAFILFLLILLPVILTLGYVTVAFTGIISAKNLVSEGKYSDASAAVELSRGGWIGARAVVSGIVPVLGTLGFNSQGDKIYRLLGIGERGTSAIAQLISIEPEIANLTKVIIGNQESEDLTSASRKISLELEGVERELGLIEAELATGDFDSYFIFGSYFGWPAEKIGKYISDLGTFRKVIHNGKAILSVLPDVLGVHGKRAYLIVFQNGSELRSTGGFIGSYAVVKVENGKLLDFKINDIYTADGQLKGRVAPPDEILHYLGQPNWYMRDANFAADFPLTAKRLEWFLEKETGQEVSGVVAVNLGAVQKIIAALGPLKIESSNEKIDGENFFAKAEYSSEINFFPGSTQKRDFLGEVAEAILGQVSSTAETDWAKLGKAIDAALMEKDVMFYFNSPDEENVFDQNGWSGSIRDENCERHITNCLMIVEANFGANKANYFVTRKVKAFNLIGKAGDIETVVKMNIVNNSPSESWPGGQYKTYLRFVVPINSKFIEMDLGDGRRASVSPVLTADVLSKVTVNQFLVFKTEEQYLTINNSSTSAYTSFGVLVNVPVKQSKEIIFKYMAPFKINISGKEVILKMGIVKQPGVSGDDWTLATAFPSFLTYEPTAEENPILGKPIVSAQEVSYNGKMVTDWNIEDRFRQNIKHESN